MTIDYSSLLSDDQKRSILQQRVQQFAAEAFQHELNLKLGEETGDTGLVAQSTQALQQIDTAIELHQRELAELTDNPA